MILILRSQYPLYTILIWTDSLLFSAIFIETVNFPIPYFLFLVQFTE